MEHEVKVITIFEAEGETRTHEVRDQGEVGAVVHRELGNPRVEAVHLHFDDGSHRPVRRGDQVLDWLPGRTDGS